MSEITTLHVGGLTVHAINAGIQRLDGGAMFGVVPKPLWQRRIAADDRNRITLAMRCLLVEHPDGLVLIDNGLGNKEPAKFRDIYGVDNSGADGRTWLEDALRTLGHAPADIRVMINSHLHFDHAGGNTFIAADDASQRVQLTFPNARYVAHRDELAWALTGNERTQASYLPHNFLPVQEAGRFDLLEGTVGTIVPGISMLVTPGHTPWHMSLFIHDGGDTLLYPADTIPTAHHLPLPWIMGYDVEPLRTLESKRALYQRAGAERWQVVFEHDAETVGGRLAPGERGGVGLVAG
ncbi:MAG TPA: MBL fold metallo-hydrolase [Gemmatimonadales bacterium]|jgi:glyoxylase-like metal-dependent hydrolase (beta-lactamase superfamily II)